MSTTTRSEIICASFSCHSQLYHNDAVNLMRSENVRPFRLRLFADDRENFGLWSCKPYIVTDTEEDRAGHPAFLDHQWATLIHDPLQEFAKIGACLQGSHDDTLFLLCPRHQINSSVGLYEHTNCAVCLQRLLIENGRILESMKQEPAESALVETKPGFVGILALF